MAVMDASQRTRGAERLSWVVSLMRVAPYSLGCAVWPEGERRTPPRPHFTVEPRRCFCSPLTVVRMRARRPIVYRGAGPDGGANPSGVSGREDPGVGRR